MNYRLIRKIYLRKTGLIVQPKLYWLGASPDGIVYDYLSKPQVGLLEIKCPYSKRNSTLSSIIKDSSFYIGLANDGKPYLKRNHQLGYFTQIQVAMGLSGIKWCDFVVYIYEGLIITRVDFDEKYFKSVINKMNTFYRDFYIDELIKNNLNT